jgi:hypothetical protein
MITLIFLQTFITLTAPANERFTIPMPEPLSVELNWHNIEREILRCGILFPDTVMLQIRLESANLTSRLCLEDANLLGMHYPKKRPTTATGRVKKNGMAHYDCWQDCIRDYRAWQDFMYKGGDYLNFLSRVYATDIYYVSKLKRL